jgi:F-type H+-transporting ATPase subunit b
MQVVENIALISINATLVVQLVSFLLFMVLFNRIMIRPLRTIMVERDRFVDNVKIEVVEAGKVFEEMQQQIQDQENDARQAASVSREELVAAGQQSVADALKKTRLEIGQLREAAQKDVDDTLAAARQQIQAEAEVLADHMVASLLSRRSAH